MAGGPAPPDGPAADGPAALECLAPTDPAGEALSAGRGTRTKDPHDV